MQIFVLLNILLLELEIQWKGSGTNKKILNRVIITRNEIDIPIIKQYYKVLYSRDILEDIKDDVSGDYRKLLVGMINNG